MEHLASSTSVIISNADENVNTSFKNFSRHGSALIRRLNATVSASLLYTHRISQIIENGCRGYAAYQRGDISSIRDHAPERVEGSSNKSYAVSLINMPRALTVAFDHTQRIDGAVTRADLDVHMRLILVLAGDLCDRTDRISRAELLTLFHCQL